MAEKLIRDKVADNARARGVELETRQASPAEFRRLLDEKLVEEAGEVGRTKSRGRRIKELADLNQVFEDLLVLHGISIVEVLSEQQRKCKKSGGFSKRTVLITEEGGE
ncbi:MAG: nucleoside triphosphate pyrophosphohydrolase [Candidatus Pacebacteria bacterium]|nr:nucleoside triphosphate pyrophosphohydrolase [Candidatus Paceibacterota bacterium]